MVAGKLTCEYTTRDRLEQLYQSTQFALGDKMHPGALALRLEGPRPVDGMRPFNDVDVEATRSVELGELRHLLEFFGLRRFGAFAKARAKAGRPFGQLLDRALGGLPARELFRIRHIVEDDVGVTSNDERFLDAHRHRSTARDLTMQTEKAARAAPNRPSAPER